MDGIGDGIDHVEGDAAYRPVAVGAVLGFILAVASALALATPWLTVLPYVAAVVCWTAARDVRGSGGEKTGFGVAAAGLALAVTIAAAAAARGAYAEKLHVEAAEPIAEAFLAHVAQSEYVAAHELTLDQRLRRPSTEAAALFYDGDADAKLRLADFRANEVIARLAAAGGVPRLVERYPASRLRGGRMAAVWLYELPPAEDSQPMGLSLKMERSSSHSGKPAWKVADFQLVPSAGPNG